MTRERYAEIMALRATGMSQKGIASTLGTSPKTVWDAINSDIGEYLTEREGAKGRYGGEPTLPLGPWQAWIRRMEVKYGGLEALSRACGVGSDRLRRYRRGWGCSTHKGGSRRHLIYSVSLRIVDEALVREGSTTLDELYPPSPSGILAA